MSCLFGVSDLRSNSLLTTAVYDTQRAHPIPNILEIKNLVKTFPGVKP